MSESTHDALREHMAKWREKYGATANPFGEVEEKVRWLCERLDAVVEEHERGKR
jgi:hypothetical protein